MRIAHSPVYIRARNINRIRDGIAPKRDSARARAVDTGEITEISFFVLRPRAVTRFAVVDTPLAGGGEERIIGRRKR